MTRPPAFSAAPALAALLLASCALPAAPGDYPSDFVPTPTAAGSGGSLLSPDGFDLAQRMTVRVRNVGCGTITTGTGFAVDAHTVVTNRHVIEGSQELEISTYDGHVFSATATESTTVADLAIVRVEEELEAVAVLATEDPEVGVPVTIVGYPLGGRLSTVKAVVLQTNPEDVDPDIGPAFGTTAALEGGESGAPVVNADGQVVGVVYGKHPTRPQSFFIPVSTLVELLAEPSLFIPSSTECE